MKMLNIEEVRCVAGGVDPPTVTVPDISMPMAPIGMAQVAPSPCSAAAFGNAALSGAGAGGEVGYEAADQAEGMGDPSDNGAEIIAGNVAASAAISTATQAYKCVKSKL